MSEILNFDSAEILLPEDATAIGETARDARDALVGGALAWPAHWARITVAKSSANAVTLEIGELYEGAKVYGMASSKEVNLQTYKPIVATDERWVGIILRGEEETISETRSFETSEAPLSESIPVESSTPKRIVRRIVTHIAQGETGPAPQSRPAIGETDCCVAFVRLTQNGVEEVVANEEARVKSVYEIEGRLTVVEVRLDRIVQETEQIATDVGNVAAAVEAVRKQMISKTLIDQMTRDISILRQEANFPEAARNYYFDQGLVPDDWDLEHLDSNTRIEEGIRHGYEAVRDDQLRLFDPGTSLVKTWDNQLVMPAYTEAMRIESPKGSGRQDLANTVHTIRTAVRHTRTHERIRYGETVTVCENRAGWGSIADRRPSEVFSVGGEEFVSRGVADTQWNRTGAFDGHRDYAAQRVIRDTYTSSYVTYNTEEFGLSGAIHAQSFLNAQIMVATSIDLNFTRVGSTGDVTLCIVRLNPAGAPDFDAVIADVTKPVGELETGWVRFEIPPTLLEQGNRYAWVVTTTGNHQLSTNSGNTFAGGTKFLCTDGIWSQGSTTEDFAFRLNAAKFERARTVVEMESVSLTGGMSQIDMIFKGFEPAGTSRWWEIKVQGSNNWIPLDAREDNPLANKPALAQLRLVLEGTEDIAPGIVLDTHARCITGRLKTEMTAVSVERVFGFSTATLQIVANVDYFDDARHTANAKVIVDGTTLDADAITITRDPNKATRVKLVADFALASNASAARLMLETTTDNELVVPFVQDVQFNAY